MEEETRSYHVERLRLRIVGAHCSTCVIPIRRSLERATGVHWVSSNPVLDVIFVDYDPKLTDPVEILATVRRAGYEAVQAAV